MAIGSDFVLGLAKTDPRLSQEKTFGVIDSGLDADFISRTSDGPTKDSKENIGHGTHVSGTIVNNAVSAKIQMHTAFPPPTAPTDQPLDMFEEGNRQTEYALRQLDDAISKGSSHVINLSLGGGLIELADDRNPYIALLNAAQSKNVVFVKAAGNDDAPLSPVLISIQRLSPLRQ